MKKVVELTWNDPITSLLDNELGEYPHLGNVLDSANKKCGCLEECNSIL